jgi:hypothetical protein
MLVFAVYRVGIYLQICQIVHILVSFYGGCLFSDVYQSAILFYILVVCIECLDWIEILTF